MPFPRVGARERRHTVSRLARPSEGGVRCLDDEVCQDRIIRSHRPGERIRIVGDAKSSAHDKRRRCAVGHANPRREQALLAARFQDRVARIRRRRFPSGSCPGCSARALDRLASEPGSIRNALRTKRQAIVHLPLIARVEAVALHPRRIWGNGLVQSPELIGQAEQKRAPRVEAVPGRPSRQLRRSAAETETAAGAVVVAC